MMDKGYPDWPTPGAASDATRDEFFEAQEPFDAELHILWDWDNYPDGPPQVDLSELRNREIQIALADWDCRYATSYDDRSREIDLDLQHEFVNQHWLALEDWARAVEDGLVPRTVGFFPISIARRF